MSLSYQLVRSSRRKTVGLQVKNGQVIVRAPLFVSKRKIEAIVKSKTCWLLEKISLQQQIECLPVDKLANGGKVWIKGVEKSLTIIFSQQTSVTEFATEIQVVLLKKFQILPEEVQHKAMKVQLEQWFKLQAEAYIQHKLPLLSQQTELYPISWRIKKYKARWGSCNSKKEVSFNYLLMMLPSWVFDYVIIHELCHLKYLNHSSAFWQLVQQQFPLYKAAKIWLKNHHKHLQWHQM